MYNYSHIIKCLFGKIVGMTTNKIINYDTAYKQDVTTMSYEELMETIRFLDHEREEIKKSVERRPETEYVSYNKLIRRVA